MYDDIIAGLIFFGLCCLFVFFVDSDYIFKSFLHYLKRKLNEIED
jgi:hypothetical protein